MIIRPHRFVLDAEAFSALAAGNRAIQPWLEMVRRTDSTLWISSLTLAETSDGTARDVAIRRAIKAVRRVPVDDEIGFVAGRLRAQAEGTRRKLRDLTVDSVVAATALALPDSVVVLTSDSGDLLRLLDGTSVRVEHLG